MKTHKLPALRALPMAVALLAVGAAMITAQASSHREGPFITTVPKVDATDFYMFKSYEAGRSEYVTLIANYLPLQDPYGGPNYFSLDPNALYEIHIDNNGDAKEDLTFQFRVRNNLKSITLPIDGKDVAIPLIQAGQVTAPNAATLNVNEQFTVDIVRGDRRSGTRGAVTKAAGGSATFDKPVDNIGTKTIPDYPGYADQHIHTVNIPGCNMPAKVFVGQRKDPFAVNLGTIFDLVNAPASVLLDPAAKNAVANTIGDKNVTTLSLEVHQSCLTAGSETVIGGWTTASLRQGALINPNPAKGHQTNAVAGGTWAQVSRLGQPLVNEVVIGLPDKDRFNASKPSGDANNFLTYVTNPTLPRLLEIALGTPAGAIAPTNSGRGDLVTVFLTGIAGVNKPANVVASEMLRLNTAIPPVALASQNRLGIVGNVLAGGSDNAGFPNGRRPKDDVVDIALVAMVGGLCMANGTTNAFGFGANCTPSAVPLGSASFNIHDAVDQAAPENAPQRVTFPYLSHPLPGAN